MKIQRVNFTNLKGATDSVELAPATLIYGRNFTGKTTITDAIKLALLGYHPALDKTAAGVMELASGDELRASVLLDNGQEIGFQWDRHGGRTTRRGSAPLDWTGTPVAVLDANAYFGLSDRGKVEYLFSVATVAGAIDEARKLLDAYGPALGAEIAARVGNAVGVQKWLDGALTAAEALRSEAAATAKRFQMTQQGNVQLGEYSTPPPVDLPIQIQEKGLALDAARAKLRDLERGQREALQDNPDADRAEKEAGKLSGLNGRKSEIERERERCDAKWKRLLALPGGVCPTCGTSVKLWAEEPAKVRSEELAEIDGRLAGVTEELTTTRRLVDNLRAKAGKAAARAKKKHGTAIEAAELAIAELTQTLSELNKQIYRYNEYVAERRRLDEARTEADKFDRREKALRGIKLKLAEAKARALESTFGPILATVALFTKGLLRNPLEFREGELGYSRNGGWVPYRTFSGTEQAIAFTAFQAALAAGGPLRVAILDELGRLDRANKAKLFENVLAALKAGVIEQFIGVDTELTEHGGTEFLAIERR
jgi:DNA repair exonuclease SbcCD ATPase subunit